MSQTLKTSLGILAVLILFFVPMDFTPHGLPWSGLKSYPTYALTLWLVTAIAAMGVNLIVGYAGQETLAQAAFLGIGAYTSALMHRNGVPFAVCFLSAGGLCFVIGIILGFPALRVQKHYLAFVTLAFSVFVWLVIRNEEWLTGGTESLRDVRRPMIFDISLQRPAIYYYWFVASITLVLTGILWWIIRSPWGRAFTALRENAVRAESLGIDVRGYTLLAFAIGSAYGGFAGSLLGPLVGILDPNSFVLGRSLEYMLMVVAGGSGYFLGPFVGAAVAVLLPEWLRFAQDYYLIIFALMVMILMAFCPTGILGLYERLTTRARRPHADDKGPTLGPKSAGGSTTVAGGKP
jgi:branched-chain amino acid transport system permease protein